MTLYRLILIPETDTMDMFYNITSNFVDEKLPYLTSPKTSLPHITFTKFEMQNEVALKNIWEQCKGADIPEITFNAINFSAGEDHTWALLFTERDKIVPLQEMLYNKVNKHGGETDHRVGNTYNPHLTLLCANTNATDIINKLNDYSLPFKNTALWKIAIGVSDDVGQINEIIFSN